jgi:predicted RNA methylase
MLRVAARLRAGEPISDGDFDRVFIPDVEVVSFRHWTPVSVARRAAELLVRAGATSILDVGAGPGKFCIVGALTTAARFTGVEQRSTLVEEARVAAERFGADRARFVHSNLVDFDCSPFNGFYFYNPFQEHLDGDDLFPIDQALERSPTLYRMYIACAIAALIRAPAATAVVTFHGLGGPMPSQYRQLYCERTFGGELALWVRRDHVTFTPAGP